MEGFRIAAFYEAINKQLVQKQRTSNEKILKQYLALF